MCNLNIILQTDKYKKDSPSSRITGFLMATTSHSFNTNDDGDGIYMSDGDMILTSENKINLIPLMSKLKESNVIITHQRWTTHGHDKKYVQPFKNDNFVIAHNGVIDSFAKVMGESDTWGFFRKFNKKFNKCKGDNRQDRIVKTIKKLLDGESGSYSIVLYDKIDNTTYYFKNSSTEIEFHVGEKKDILYITTESDNTKYLHFFKHEFVEKEIADYKIYAIKIGDTITINPIGDIKEGRTWDCYKSDKGVEDNTTPKIGESNLECNVSHAGVGGSSVKDMVIREGHDYGEGRGNYRGDYGGIHNVNNVNLERTNEIGKCCYCKADTTIKNIYRDEFVCEDCIDESITEDTLNTAMFYRDDD